MVPINAPVQIVQTATIDRRPTEIEIRISVLINRLKTVESGNNPNIIGDNGRAWGILQITAQMVSEINRMSDTDFTQLDAFDPIKAEEMARLYFEFIDSIVVRERHRHAYGKEFAFAWNGGTDAWTRVEHPKHDKKQKNLEGYWGACKVL